MTLRRGFKAEANWYAREMRAELGISPEGSLCPWKLAKHLGYNILKLSDYLQWHPVEVAYFGSDRGRREFSAFTINDEGMRWIIHNDYHHPHRQAANISHELSHGLLVHAPAPLRGSNGARTFNQQQEEEANWLGPALLVSEEAALHIIRTHQPYDVAQKTYGVSGDLLQMRLRVTGAHKRIARSRAA